MVLVSGDFVRTGGMDMPNYALARHLASRGETVQVVAYRIDDELARHPNVKWHRVPKPLNSYVLAAPLLDYAGRREAKRQAGDTRVLVNGGNCQVGDVNWVHYVHAAYDAPVTGSLARRVKSSVDRARNLRQERTALQMARLVIVNSERTRRDLVNLLDIDDARIRTVYYGIDATRFYPVAEERRQQLRAQFSWSPRPQVAFVGALGDGRKGFDTLYSAWSSLCRTSSWDCDLVVVGHGGELSKWQSRAREDGLQQRIRFLGFRRDVPDILAACDALIAPTRYEAYGLGVQEALCAGLPALVSADAGVAERYPAELAALLIKDPESANEVIANLSAWRRNSDELRRATTTVSDRMRERTWETMASEITELLL